MQAADHEAFLGFVQQGQREALVATRVGERIEADQAQTREVVSCRALEHGGPGGQFVEIATDLMDRLQVGVEDRLEALAIGAARQQVQSLPEPADLHRLKDQHQHQTQAHQDQHYCGHVVRNGIHDFLRSVARSLPADTGELLPGSQDSRGYADGDPGATKRDDILQHERKLHNERQRRPRDCPATLSGGPSTKMAKRTRGSHRPGQRHADKRAPARPQSRPMGSPSGGLSAEEEARAAEIESQIVAQDRVAEAGRARSRERARNAEVERPGRARGQGLLAARAAEEYAYVVRDVRRIVRVGGSLAAVLAVIYVLVDVLHVVTVG